MKTYCNIIQNKKTRKWWNEDLPAWGIKKVATLYCEEEFISQVNPPRLPKDGVFVKHCLTILPCKK